jgi:AraC-like DNA-binding protein
MAARHDSQAWVQIARTNGAILNWTDALGGFESFSGRSFNTTLPAHVHPSYVIGVVTAGAVRVTRCHESLVATAGDVIALAPYDVHTEIAVGDEGWSFSYLYPTERNVRQALRVTHIDDVSALLRFAHPVIRNERIQRALEMAHDLIALGASQQIVETALVALFELLTAECVASDATDKAPRYRRGVEAVRAIILQERTTSYTLPQLAEVAGLSMYHLDRVFRNLVGIPPGTFFQRVRVARAYAMILRGHPVSRVAYGLGYADQAHLTRHFHSASAMTPGQYAAIVRAARAPAKRTITD